MASKRRQRRVQERERAELIERTCTSKMAQADEAAAWAHAAALRRKKGAVTARPYPCMFCLKWHVGQRPRTWKGREDARQRSGKARKELTKNAKKEAKA